ncbi:MAG: methyltransferase domain-containing protein [Endozoicomonas sp. (ex Botrylloides leachii)]|nr:methyltransferase domain-containing protein [Endozoicomonas sp. (ex Botrylloides leachii)]
MNYELLIDLHKNNKRQGPGSEEQTKQALHLANLLNTPRLLKIADIGCGTGASTLTLAENVSAKILAVDLFQDFLDILNLDAQQRGVKHKIETLATAMETFTFEQNALDVIWSEGAIYNMGFEKGVAYFKQFLRPNGILAVSEITWLTRKRPQEIEQYWQAAYPEIATVSEKIAILEKLGFALKGYFPLPKYCWVENYYAPLTNSFDHFVAKHNLEDAQAIVESEKTEIELYKKYSSYYSYGFYVAEKV